MQFGQKVAFCDVGVHQWRFFQNSISKSVKEVFKNDVPSTKVCMGNFREKIIFRHGLLQTLHEYSE